MANGKHIQALVEMGLNVLEAEVYAHLLKESPLTGYGVAKALGKPAANVYKAIDTLADKGAVIVDEGGTRQCRAVPANEFLMRLERDFTLHRKEAAAALRHLPGPGEDTRIYQLRSRGQVFEQCRQLLADAKRVAHLDIFPDPLKELRPDVAAAVARGVEVVIKTYGTVDVEGAEILVEPDAALILARWPVQWVNVVVDASAFTMVLLSADGREVVQGVCTASPYLSYLHQGRLANELAYTALKIAIEGGASHDDLLRTFEHTRQYTVLDTPGYERLLQQIAPFLPTGKEA